MKTVAAVIALVGLSIAVSSCAGNGTVVVKEPVPARNQTAVRSLAYLEDLLVKKGLDRGRAHELLADPRLTIDPQFILSNLFPPPSPPSTVVPQAYPTYYSPRFIPLGRIFIEENRETFDCIKKDYGISPEIITAILVIESKLGTLAEEFQAFQVYTNLALADNPDILTYLQETHGLRYPGLCQEPLIKKARKRGKWAAGELYHLILLSDRLQYDPIKLKSSCAGALGPGQFIPSTFTGFGVDGDSDGRIDPFSMPDAIASIANYLKKSGWKDDGPEQEQRTAVWLYNHSETYVQTILKLYRELSENGRHDLTGS